MTDREQRERIAKVIKEAWEECGEVPFPLYSVEAESIAVAVLNAVYDRPEVLYLGRSAIPLADVQHVERHTPGGITVVTRHTRWDWERDGWGNAIWLDASEADAFMEAWTRYLSRPVAPPAPVKPVAPVAASVDDIKF